MSASRVETASFWLTASAGIVVWSTLADAPPYVIWCAVAVFVACAGIACATMAQWFRWLAVYWRTQQTWRAIDAWLANPTRRSHATMVKRVDQMGYALDRAEPPNKPPTGAQPDIAQHMRP